MMYFDTVKFLLNFLNNERKYIMNGSGMQFNDFIHIRWSQKYDKQKGIMNRVNGLINALNG